MYNGILLPIKCTRWEGDEVLQPPADMCGSYRCGSGGRETQVCAAWSMDRKHKSRQDQAVLPGVRVWPLRGPWGPEGDMQGLLGALGMLSVLIQELVTWVCLIVAHLFRFSNPV